MAEPTLSHVLLIYPVGTSDLRIRGEHGAVSNPGKNYREEIARLAQEPQPMLFPILVPILNHVSEQAPGLPIRLLFLVSDQPAPNNTTDTVGFDAIVRPWLTTDDGRAAVAAPVDVLPPIILQTNIWHYDDLAVVFATHRAVLEAYIRQATHSFYAAATGTPAMVFSAASLFGANAGLRFVYKPQPPKDAPDPPPIEINEFRRLPRQRTLSLLDDAVSTFDSGLAHRILNVEGSGFDPADAHIARPLARLAVLRDWQGEFYAEAARHAAAHGLTRANSAATALVTALQAIPERRDSWPGFWRHKLIDIATRLLIAQSRGDIPGFIDRLKHFQDVSRLFALCWYRLAQDPRGEGFWVHDWMKQEFSRYTSLDADRFTEDYQQTALMVWRIRRPKSRDVKPEAMRVWLDALLRLRFVAGKELREYRNRHIHTTVEFERNTLDNFVADRFSPVSLPEGVGASLIATLVIDTLAALPQQPGVPRSDAAPMTLLGEYLLLPRALARVHHLPSPSLSSTRLDTLRAPDEPLASILTDLRLRVREAYAEEERRQHELLIPALKDVRNIMAKAAKVPALDAGQAAKLLTAADGWDASKLPGMVASAMTGYDMTTKIEARLVRRVFADAAPGKNAKVIAKLAEDFSKSSSGPEAGAVLRRLFS